MAHPVKDNCADQCHRCGDVGKNNPADRVVVFPNRPGQIEKCRDAQESSDEGDGLEVRSECRIDDERVHTLLEPLNDHITALRVTAERAMNLRLEGGCQVPIAGYAEIDKGVLLMRGLVGSTDGSKVIRAEIAGKPENADELGTVLADDLLAQGAKEILSELYND